jgi:hypothetical protein
VNLDALEVTDLDKGARSTARFFNGSKLEYSRRMHCFHGSDAHRLTGDPRNPKRLGIGERASEFLLEEPSFESVQNLLRSKQFDRTRPARAQDEPFDPLAVARSEGPSLVQSFHESASQRGGRMAAILSDICAFANTVGGAIYIGANPRKPKPSGLAKPAEVEQEVQAALAERLKPPLDVKFDVLQSQGVKVLRIQVPKGPERPYCLDDYKFYVRDETESTLAVRDEVVALVREVLEAQYAVRPAKNGDRYSGDRYSGDRYSGDRQGNKGRQRPDRRQPAEPRSDMQASDGVPAVDALAQNGEFMAEVDVHGADRDDAFYLPQVGVEIVASDERQGGRYHSIRDLRNGHVIKNVTRKGARKLWSYAIQQREDSPVDQSKVQWRGNIGLVNSEKRAGKTRYDLALRENGNIRVFYGVTEDGMEGRWAAFIQDEGS